MNDDRRCEKVESSNVNVHAARNIVNFVISRAKDINSLSVDENLILKNWSRLKNKIEGLKPMMGSLCGCYHLDNIPSLSFILDMRVLSRIYEHLHESNITENVFNELCKDDKFISKLLETIEIVYVNKVARDKFKKDITGLRMSDLQDMNSEVFLDDYPYLVMSMRDLFSNRQIIEHRVQQSSEINKILSIKVNKDSKGRLDACYVTYVYTQINISETLNNHNSLEYLMDGVIYELVNDLIENAGVLFLNLCPYNDFKDEISSKDKKSDWIVEILHNLNIHRFIRYSKDDFAIILEEITKEEVYELAESIISIYQKKEGMKNAEVTVGLLDLKEISSVKSDSVIDAKLILSNYEIFKSKILHNALRGESHIIDILPFIRTEVEIINSLGDPNFIGGRVYLQPIVDKYGVIKKFELLTRYLMQDVLVYPEDLFPIINNIDKINEFNSWIVNFAVEIIKGWKKHGVWEEGTQLNINTSVLNEEFYSLLKSKIESNEIDGSDLEIEIVTLDNILSSMDAENVKVYLQKIRDLGCTIAVDDFFEESTLVDVVKIVKFINTLKVGKSCFNFTDVFPGLIGFIERYENIAHIVFEGVDSTEKIDLLSDLNDEKILLQGDAISPPSPIEVIEKEVLKIPFITQELKQVK